MLVPPYIANYTEVGAEFSQSVGAEFSQSVGAFLL